MKSVTFAKSNNVYNDKDNSHQMLHKIMEHIDSADIFVCDMTPDHVLNEKIPLPNPNAMIELGYRLSKFLYSNIILLLDEKITKEVPSMLKGFNITYYNSSKENYHVDIIEKINEIEQIY
jgi:predicted nucleotide-binding protein